MVEQKGLGAAAKTAKGTPHVHDIDPQECGCEVCLPTSKKQFIVIMPGPGQKEAEERLKEQRALPEQTQETLKPYNPDRNCSECVIERIERSRVHRDPDRGHKADAPDPPPSEQMRENLKEKMRKTGPEICISCPRDGVCKTHSPGAEDLKQCCVEMRKELLTMIGCLAGLIENHPAMVSSKNPRTPNNALANAWLTFRALEDAYMRLEKVDQMLDGGKLK